MKLELKLTNDWLEATWYEDDKQVHCESFSGHPEHIAMLRTKALEFGTELDETVVAECIANFKMPTEAELLLEANRINVAEAKAYLASTDFKMTIDYFATLTEIEQTGLTAKRAEVRSFLKEQGL